jgi:amino acid adenylation domain-containing protein
MGHLDVVALERSFNEIIRRHQAWRTSFPTLDGLPVQAIHPATKVSLPVEDLRYLPKAEREAEAVRLATEEARRPFDLAHGPLLRAKLIRLDDSEHRLFLTLHHIIFDGVSIYRVFLPELTALYEAFSNGKLPPLSEPPIQYADFACWQRQWLQEKTVLEHMAYWKKQLAGHLPVLQLPTDRARPAVQSFRGAMQPFELTRQLTAQLKALSQQEGVTLFITLLAAFNTLLYRYSGQDDLLVGTATAGRNRVELESLIGFFLNTVVLRTNVSGNPSFRELLKRVRQVTVEALSHDDVPFEHLVKELQPKRDLSHNPLFQVLFSLEPPLQTLDSGWKLTQMDVETGAAKFDLYLELDDRPEGLIGRFTYSTDLFDGPTIARMVQHWQKLLEGVVANPGLRLAELPLLTNAERRQLCVEWNDSRRDYSQICVHELFEAQVNRTPDAIAVTFENRQLSYRELNRRANQLARYLRRLGVGPEVLVGICAERSIEMVVGLLGILKAGGAYVPLDPAYPKERLRDVLSDAGVTLLLTQKRLMRALPPPAAEVVWLDANWKAISRESDANLPVQAGPKNLAYVIYTSGSTGKPKGVQIEHRSLVNFLNSMQREPGLTGDDVLLAVTTLSFDIAGLEIYLPLVVGARLVVASREAIYDGSRLMALLADSGATVMQATPATWRLLLAAGWQGAADLKILCGGEALPPELARQLVARSGSLWNLYGPTETTIWSSLHRVDGNDEERVPIGRPIANTEFYILDNERQPVPVGVDGELYIGGDGLARGYLGHPQLTAEKFVAHPFSSQPGQLYKTGDLARYRPEGNIEYLGRVDNQVKIRGFRIELGEIEAVLARQVGVRQGVVIVREDEPGEKRLVAYIVKAAERAPTTKELRSYLKKKLPDYMVPAAFVTLDTLPLTPNGKVDRNSLPAPEQLRIMSQDQFAPPRDVLESTLVHIWQSLLGSNPIGIRDNFFDLGGHSLLAAKLIHQVEQTFGKILSINTLFEASTIERLATVLRERSPLPRLSRVVPIQPAGFRPPFFCIGAGPLFWPLAQRLGSDQPFLGLGLNDSDKDKLHAPYTLGEIAGCLVKSMRELQPKGPYFLGGWCGDGLIAYETARQLRAQGQEVALLALFEVPTPARYGRFSQVRRISLLVERLGFHFANLRRLGSAGLRSYFLRQLQEFLRKIRRVRWRFSYDLRLRINDGRLRDLEQIIYVASSAYRPEPYPGRATIFQCAERSSGPDWDLQPGWAELVKGGLKVYQIPGDHRTIFVEPNVEILASKLGACLHDNRLSGTAGDGPSACSLDHRPES